MTTPPQEASVNPSKRITIHCGEELMAHLPSGQVKFLTFIGFIKLAWWAVRNKVEIDIVDGGKR